MKKILYILVFLNCFISSYGQFTAPHIKNFTTKEYGDLKSPEVYSVSQDENGVMYFGFVNEIGVFDGVKWEFIPVDGAKYITSLLYANGKISVGGPGLFNNKDVYDSRSSTNRSITVDVPNYTGNSGSTGGGQSHNNLQPSLVDGFLFIYAGV